MKTIMELLTDIRSLTNRIVDNYPDNTLELLDSHGEENIFSILNEINRELETFKSTAQFHLRHLDPEKLLVKSSSNPMLLAKHDPEILKTAVRNYATGKQKIYNPITVGSNGGSKIVLSIAFQLQVPVNGKSNFTHVSISSVITMSENSCTSEIKVLDNGKPLKLKKLEFDANNLISILDLTLGRFDEIAELVNKNSEITTNAIKKIKDHTTSSAPSKIFSAIPFKTTEDSNEFILAAEFFNDRWGVLEEGFEKTEGGKIIWVAHFEDMGR